MSVRPHWKGSSWKPRLTSQEFAFCFDLGFNKPDFLRWVPPGNPSGHTGGDAAVDGIFPACSAWLGQKTDSAMTGGKGIPNTEVPLKASLEAENDFQQPGMASLPI